jgi:hypothetical protein
LKQFTVLNAAIAAVEASRKQSAQLKSMAAALDKDAAAAKTPADAARLRALAEITGLRPARLQRNGETPAVPTQSQVAARSPRARKSALQDAQHRFAVPHQRAVAP